MNEQDRLRLAVDQALEGSHRIMVEELAMAERRIRLEIASTIRQLAPRLDAATGEQACRAIAEVLEQAAQTQ